MCSSDLVWGNLSHHVAGKFRAFEDSDLAMEWCENRLLETKPVVAGSGEEPVEPHDYELLKGLSAAELAEITPRLTRKKFTRGQTVIQAGSEARELFFLARGSLSILVPLTSGETKRVATVCPGMAFGELALLEIGRAHV